MKTLDDVIKAWEICDETVTANCPNCPYDIDCENVPGEDLKADTLHYLKEYRDYVGVLRVKEMQLDQDIATCQEVTQQCEETLKDYLALKQDYAEAQDNPLLTWDELKQMESKPIWVELLYHHPEQEYKYWDIIKRFDMVEDCELVVLSKTGYLYKSLLGKQWKGYKKERK